MKYTKEQAEMLALLVIMGCALMVLSFLYLVKPKFTTIAQCKKEMNKAEAEMSKLSNAPMARTKAKMEMDDLTGVIDRGEKAVFSGLGKGPPLSEVCVQAATALGLKPAYGEQTNKQLLEFTDRGPDGKPVTKHYDEVVRTLDVRGVDFYAFCRFLSAVEGANEGLTVTQIEMDAGLSAPQAQGRGTVNAKFEVSMVGIREGEHNPETIDISGHKNFNVGERRNPFGSAAKLEVVVEDPLRRVREVLGKVKIRGVWADSLLVEFTEKGKTGQDVTRSVETKKGETAVIGGVKVKYLQGAGDSFVFEATEHAVRFVLERNSKGEVRAVKQEEEAK